MTGKRVWLILPLVLACAGGERPRSGGTGGEEPASTGGQGASATGGASGKPDATAGSTGGKNGASDAAATMTSLDGPPSSGDPWAKCGPESFKPGISAADFCAKYMSVCGFDPAGGAGGKSRFKSLDDCVAKYNGLTDTPRGGRACVAYHLCVAISPENTETFCPHAPEAAAMTGPCKMSYL